MSEIQFNKGILQDTSAASMTRAIEENLLDSPRQIARALGTEIHDTPNLLWTATGVPIGMGNGVYRSILTPDTVDALIEQVQEEFHLRRLPLMWQVGPSTQPPDLRQRLLAHGFVLDEEEPGMALDILTMNEDFPVPAELDIRLADSLPMLAAWVATWGFPIPVDTLALFQEVYTRIGSDPHLPWRHFLGFIQEKPVATSALFLGAGAAEVEDVATLPEARHKGIGTAMTLAALREARSAGYHIATLTASPYGERIYRRIGFRDYCMISRYRWRAMRD